MPLNSTGLWEYGNQLSIHLKNAWREVYLLSRSDTRNYLLLLITDMLKTLHYQGIERCDHLKDLYDVPNVNEYSYTHWMQHYYNSERSRMKYVDASGFWVLPHYEPLNLHKLICDSLIKSNYDNVFRLSGVVPRWGAQHPTYAWSEELEYDLDLLDLHNKIFTQINLKQIRLDKFIYTNMVSAYTNLYYYIEMVTPVSATLAWHMIGFRLYWAMMLHELLRLKSSTHQKQNVISQDLAKSLAEYLNGTICGRIKSHADGITSAD